MKLLVSGSRAIQDDEFVASMLDSVDWDFDTIMHGDADGVDTSATRWAVKKGIDVETHEIPEWVWSKVGTKAGPMRNDYMVEQANAVVVIWDGESSGTKDVLKKADAEGVPLRKVVVDVDGDGVVQNVVIDKVKDDNQTCLHDYGT